MATLTPVEGNPFEGVAKPSTQVMTNEDFGIAKLPVPTSETPEYLGAKVSLPESFKMFMGTMATTDPRALQDIILSSVEGSQGGEDEKGNPYVVIGGKPFYTNKQGLSPVDAVGFVGDIIQFIPAAKLASVAKSAATRLGIAGVTSGGISAAKETAAQMLGSQQEFDTFKVGLDTAFGAGGQVVGDALTGYIRARKPVFNSAGEVSGQFKDILKQSGINFDEFGEKGKEAIVNAYKNLGSKFAQEADRITSVASAADTGRIPLTLGQSTGDVRQIAQEEAMRNAGRGSLAQKIMQRFDIGQRKAIEEEAGVVSRAIAPDARSATQTEAGGTIYEMLRGQKQQIKSGMTKAYDATDLRALNIPVSAVDEMPLRVQKVIQEQNLVLDPKLTPSAAEAFNEVKNAVPKMEGVNVTDINLKSLENTRKKLNSFYGAAANDTDRAVISAIRNEFDNWLDDTITKGLASGDADQLAKLKDARAIARDYYSKFKVDPKSADVDAQKIIDKIASKDLTAVETMNYLFGTSKIGENQVAVRVAKKFKDIFGENSEQFNEFRQAAYMRLVQDTQGNVKPASKIVKEVDELIMGKGSQLANEIFTPEQVKSLREFRTALAKTITPSEAMNPSKTGYEIARLGEDLLKGFGVMTMAGGDVATGAGLTAATGLVKPLRGAGSAYQATRGVTAPTLQGSYGAPVGVSSGGAISDLLRERESQQTQGLLGR
jgi:copper chaperone CopZ